MKQNLIIFIKHIAEQFKHVYSHSQEQEQVAWWLVQALTKKSKAQLIAQKEIALTEKQEQQLAQWVEQHSKNLKPLQYILGSVPFCDLDIIVKSPVLIPRPETEEWCYNLIEQLKKLPNKKIKILDLCTGSGCIALALAKALPEVQVTGTDISDDALALAKKNAKHNNILNVTFIKSDVYGRVPKESAFDLIVANPPYIAETEWEQLSPMVKKWEDRHALVANQEGLAIIRRIIDKAHTFLIPNGEFQKLGVPQLVIEIGYLQGDSVKYLMENAGFQNVTITKDLAGKDRIVSGGLA